MKALVIGGAGFVGRHLTADLLERGWEVVVADVADHRERPAGSEFVRCDVRQPLDERLGEGVDRVYNLAAVHRTPGHERHEYFDTNVPGARHVIELCERHDINTLVFTSSISVYGPREERVDESTEPAPASAYGESKLEAEAIHRAWFDADDDRRLVVVRPAVIFGRGEDGNFTRLARALRQRRFVYPGRTDTIKGCGYVGELTEVFEFLVTQGERFELANFAYPSATTIADICAVMASEAGLPRPLGRMPLGPVKAVAMVFEGLEKLGLRTGINRDRVDKLVLSTNVWPGRLEELHYPWTTDLAAGVRAWKADSPDLT